MIKSVREEGLSIIADLWEQMVLEKRPDWKPNKDIWVKMASHLFKSPAIKYTILLATEDNTPVGFIDGMFYAEPATGELHGVAQHFFVVPKLRKTTVATQLYKGIISCALQENIEAIDFFCFPEEQKFWTKRGYFPERILMRGRTNV